MRVFVDKIHTSGFQLERRRGPRNPATFLTDTDFANDIALISSRIADAEILLNSLESAANCVGLYLNESKTEYSPSMRANLSAQSKQSLVLLQRR